MVISDRLKAVCGVAITLLTVHPAWAADVDRFAQAAMQATDQGPASSPLTLRVISPTGRTSHLTYRPRRGWAFDDPSIHIPSKARATKAVAKGVAPDSGVGNDLLDVFIDGPTGNTFVWIRGKGWTYEGRVVDRSE